VKSPPADRSIRETIPCLPLRDLVVFPGMAVPLFVGRMSSVGAVEAAAGSGKKRLLAVAQKDASVEEPGRPDLYDVGCVIEITQQSRLPDGTLKVLVEGRDRARIDKWQPGRDCVLVQVETLDSDPQTANAEEFQALTRNVIHRFEEYIRLSNKMPVEAAMAILHLQDPSALSDAVASHLSLTAAVRQKLLETLSVESRMFQLSELLEKEIEIARLESRIRGRVRKQMEELQREHYLNEQVKAIQKELGYGDDKDDIQSIRETIEKSGMPAEVKEKALKELLRLQKMPPLSPESTVVRTYLGWLTDLPWNRRTEDSLDLKRAKAILDEDHYGLKKPKERILEYLAVCKLAGKIKGPILCLVGPPGVGKTSLGKSIARALGREFVRMSLGGVRDEAEIRGHRRTYIGALPGRILQLIAKAKSKNPVVLLDEIDKMSVDFRGDPSAALLEVLDPEQNAHFVDHYLEVGFDLSECLFVTTANVRFAIPYPLFDRMEIIDLPGYTEPEKLEIARGFLIPKQMRENGLEKKPVRVTPSAIRQVVRRYTNEAGVRDLERHVGKILRQIARVVASGKRGPRQIHEKMLTRYLGVPQVHSKHTMLAGLVEAGTAAGLAWTEQGGDVLLIEVEKVPGKGNLILTGRLGDVMKESGQAALTFARSVSERLSVRPEVFRKFDFHVHVSEGAIPKDGPSAGITMASALLSVLLGRPIPRGMAMTGEITLRGRILPVGGLRSKLMAALRYGMTQVILPMENKPQVSEIPANEIRGLKLHYVESIREALPILFPGRRGAQGVSGYKPASKGSSIQIPATH